MNLKPIEQKNLYELNEYLHELINLNEKNKLPNKLIFSGQKGIGKSTLAYHLTNYLLSTNEANSYDIVNFKINESNRSFNLIKNLTHPNFFSFIKRVKKKY